MKHFMLLSMMFISLSISALAQSQSIQVRGRVITKSLRCKVIALDAAQCKYTKGSLLSVQLMGIMLTKAERSALADQVALRLKTVTEIYAVNVLEAKDGSIVVIDIPQATVAPCPDDEHIPIVTYDGKRTESFAAITKSLSKLLRVTVLFAPE